MPEISVSGLVAVGRGVERPEHVLVTPENHVLASDKASGIAEVSVAGELLRRIGDVGGDPNGFAYTRAGTALVANFGQGLLQEVDLVDGTTTAVNEGEVCGRSIRWVNFALVDSTGAAWVSVSTENPDLMDTVATGAADGFLYRLDPEGRAPTVVAAQVGFPNCMALDEDERYLYVVRTVTADVVRFPVEDGTHLGAQEIFSPPLGHRGPAEFGQDARALVGDPEAMRRWGMADGCGFDADGNLWVTLVSAHRVVAVTPDREVVTVFEDPEGTLLNSPTSVAWGGTDLRDVYFGSLAAPYLLKGRSSVAGMPMVHQRGRLADTEQRRNSVSQW